MRRLVLALSPPPHCSAACGSDEPTPAAGGSGPRRPRVTVDDDGAKGTPQPSELKLDCAKPTDSAGVRRRGGRLGGRPAQPTPATSPARRSSAGRRRRRSRARSAATPSTRRSRAPTAARSRAGTSVEPLLAAGAVSYQVDGPARAEASSSAKRESLDEAIDVRARTTRAAVATRRERDRLRQPPLRAARPVGARIELKGRRRTRRRRRPRRRLGRSPGPAGASRGIEPLDGESRSPRCAARSQRERRAVAAQPRRVLAPVAASARRAAARSAASGPSPRCGQTSCSTT